MASSATGAHPPRCSPPASRTCGRGAGKCSWRPWGVGSSTPAARQTRGHWAARRGYSARFPRGMVDKQPGIIYDTTMPVYQVVIDTNVWIAALRSKRGASHKLLSLIGSGKYEANISVPLVPEYEDTAKRLVGEIALTERDIDDILDYVCAVANHRRIYYLWR